MSAPVKPGIRTTEFAMTALMVVGTILTFFFGHSVDLTPYAQPVATAASAVAVVGYAISRALVKAKIVPESAADPVLQAVDAIDPDAEAQLSAVFADDSDTAAADAIAPAADAGFASLTGILAGLGIAGLVLAGFAGAALVAVFVALLVVIVRNARSSQRPTLQPSTVREMPAGTIGVTPSSGVMAWLIRHATGGPVAHSFLATGVGDQVIEGDPHGARYNRASHYKTVYWLTNLSAGMTDVDRAAAVAWDRDHIGTPYSWLDCIYIALVDLFGWAPAFMRRQLASTRTLMCSQMCDESLRAGGRQLFADGRPAGGVSPNDLYRLDAAERVQSPSLTGPLSFRTLAV